MAFDPTTGLEGRVATGAGSTPVAGVMEWRIQKQCTPIPINHFELSADGDGVIWQVFAAGLASATATVRGHYNVDATDKTESGTPAFAVGTAITTLDLIFEKTAPFGYLNLAGIITQFNAGTNIENQTATYDMTVQLSGAVGKAA